MKSLERMNRALELRKGGVSYAFIASELGYASPSGAHKAVMSALKKTLQEPADELRQLEVERLDALLAVMWSRKSIPDFTDRILKIMERRAKLLGLDAPTRANISGELSILIDWDDASGFGNDQS